VPADASRRPAPGTTPGTGFPETPGIPLRKVTARLVLALVIVAGFALSLWAFLPCATVFWLQTAGLMLLAAGMAAAVALACRATWRWVLGSAGRA
jgi:hypothetical protein